MTSFAYVHTLGGVVARKVDETPARTTANAMAKDAGTGVSNRWFFDSSFELKHGLIVQEVNAEALPNDVFERLFHR